MDLDLEGLNYSARMWSTTPEAVIIALQVYHQVCRECPDKRPGPELSRRLEIPENKAIGLIADYVLSYNGLHIR
jgi:hypothetical protein